KQNRNCSRHKTKQERKQPRTRNFSKPMNSCTTHVNKCKKHSKITVTFCRGKWGQVPRPPLPIWDNGPVPPSPLFFIIRRGIQQGDAYNNKSQPKPFKHIYWFIKNEHASNCS